MSAQYRPYRDEESVDGMEATSWTDNEPGTIQIYEKTTEELPFNSNSRRAFWVQVASIVTVGILGFLLGYFAPFHQTHVASSSPSSAAGGSLLDDGELPEHLRATYSAYEDPIIKDKLLEELNGENILKMLTQYGNTNRIPGSPADHDFAQDIAKSFDAYHFDRITVTNQTFRTMLPGKASVVKLLDRDGKTIYSNVDNEKYPHEDMRPFLPLSQANETDFVTNQLLYINRGTKDDYVRLSSLGLSTNDTNGRVLVIRQTFYQAHDIIVNAQESGARAILLFPDPEIYGWSSSAAPSSAFPDPVKCPSDAGRVHPTAWSNYGDLASFNLTGGIDASKLGLDKEAKVSVPVIPISFRTAEAILRGLSGVQAPKDWNCFDFTLYIGPTYRDEQTNLDKRDKIQIQFYNKDTEITSTTVTGLITGLVEADRYIMVGSRRDSLNRGVLDSVSGTAVMMEIARVFGALVKQGWRPRRTIIFNSFGSESLNLIGSSNWLETHQRLLHSRAVAYLNCDVVVTGNRSAAIAASPLLYQVLFNTTEQVPNPNMHAEPKLATVYDAWREAQTQQRATLQENNGTHQTPSATVSPLETVFQSILNEIDTSGSSSRLVKEASRDDVEDTLGVPGGILSQFKKSATAKQRPRVRRLDLHSIYSPFFLYAGIPVIDIRYAGFRRAEPMPAASGDQSYGNDTDSHLAEDVLPIIGTKCDNLDAILKIDPHLKYHVTVAQLLAEMIRDLSDSVFLPFNLLDYAITLKDSFSHFHAQYGKTFAHSDVDLGPFMEVIQEFARAAVQFHHRQDMIDPRDALKVRKFNDQLMLLERVFLDSNNMPSLWDRKHIILSPNDGLDRKEGFPGLVDWLSLLEDVLESELPVFVELLKVQYRVVIDTISNAIRIIEDVYML